MMIKGKSKKSGRPRKRITPRTAARGLILRKISLSDAPISITGGTCVTEMKGREGRYPLLEQGGRENALQRNSRGTKSEIGCLQ